MVKSYNQVQFFHYAPTKFRCVKKIGTKLQLDRDLWSDICKNIDISSFPSVHVVFRRDSSIDFINPDDTNVTDYDCRAVWVFEKVK